MLFLSSCTTVYYTHSLLLLYSKNPTIHAFVYQVRSKERIKRVLFVIRSLRRFDSTFQTCEKNCKYKTRGDDWKR